MDARTIVLDNGADTCKIGFSTQSKPRWALYFLRSRISTVIHAFLYLLCLFHSVSLSSLSKNRIVNNCGVRPKRGKYLIADQIDEILDFSGCVYKRPHERVNGAKRTSQYNPQTSEPLRCFSILLSFIPSLPQFVNNNKACSYGSH